MTDENTTPASAPADTATTMPAEHSPASHHHEHYQEQPAETPEHDNYEEHEEPADLGSILEDRPKKLSGAQRAKLQKEYLQNELREREQRIEALERHIGERDENDRRGERERQAEAQRKRDGAHLERLKETRGTVTDFDRVMAKMNGVQVRDELIDEIKSSDKSALLAYHLASHPDKLAELNHMSDGARAREIGRLEASLKMPSGKKQTTAPPPPSTLRGGAAPHTRLEDVGDMKTFATRLIKDLAKRKER
jgi:hypothetical protein